MIFRRNAAKPFSLKWTIEPMRSLKPLTLATARLDVVAATLDHIHAELESPERLAALLQADIDAGWPPGEYDRGAQEFFRDRLREGGPETVGWYTWYAIRRGGPQRALVGAAGFLGPPSEEGDAEIGFSIMPAWRGQGYATELVGMLLTWAFDDPRVRRILAHTTPQNAASCRVLEKSGFHPVGRAEESQTIRFELPRPLSFTG